MWQIVPATHDDGSARELCRRGGVLSFRHMCAAQLRPVAVAVLCLVVARTGLSAAPAESDRAAAQELRAIVKAAAGGKSDDSVPPRGGPAVERWLRANGESVGGVQPSPLPDQPWGWCTYRPASGGQPGRLYLHVFDWHASGKTIVYGLGGDVKRASLLGDAQKTALEVNRTDRAVIVAGPKQPPDALDTVVVLELEGEPKAVPLAVRPKDDGSIVLHARDSIVHGRTLRYEPEPHKNTVGYWMDPADWVEWPFEVPAPGRYRVEILQGCGKGSGGSTVDFSAAGQTLGVTVQETGGFQNFVSRDIGTLNFERPGRHTLSVKPVKKPGVAVMDLQQVTLVPVPAK